MTERRSSHEAELEHAPTLLEVNYRLQLRDEWQAATLSQLTALEQQLYAEQQTAQAATRKVKELLLHIKALAEDAAQNQLLVQDLYEESKEMQHANNMLEAAAEQAAEAYRELQSQLAAAHAHKGGMEGQMAELLQWQHAAQDSLRAKDDETASLREELRNVQVRASVSVPSGANGVWSLLGCGAGGFPRTFAEAES
jgi:hypothetical protein